MLYFHFGVSLYAKNAPQLHCSREVRQVLQSLCTKNLGKLGQKMSHILVARKIELHPLLKTDHDRTESSWVTVAPERYVSLGDKDLSASTVDL